MKRTIMVLAVCVTLPVAAHAQFGNLINNLKNNPTLTSQAGVQGIISKAQSLAAMFAQMPLTSGKLALVKASLPMLSQAMTASKDPASTGKVSGLLDQVKGLFAQKWDTSAIAPTQLPQANDLMSQFSSAISGIVKNEGGKLGAMLGQPATK